MTNISPKPIAITYLVCAAAFLAIDIIWIGIVANPIYEDGIGQFLRDQPKIGAAAIFYLMYVAGNIIFAVKPNDPTCTPKSAWLMGSLFGFFAYATYDVTNFATIKDWPILMSVIDTAWGAFLSGIIALIGRWTFDRVNTNTAS